ncbi:hypothetical protein NLI96_g4351 [Meripilus lineatus]|uniref:Uncharacterized protein n=1 Tax=Meripilus lineatus TaxID=2056292 RepID=A0AAD5V533_9APHY|nr:hypothetical protein NLI96_g4351 [Physisporinus lineatus]
MSDYNYTIDDSSSVLTFLPYSDGSSSGGWQTWFSTAGFNKEGGQESIGDSRHTTAFPGASVTMTFHGTAIYLYGNATCTYEVTVDSQTYPQQIPTSDTVLLYSQTGLNPGKHSFNLTAHPDGNGAQSLFFDYAVFTDVIPGANAALIPLQIDNQDNTKLQYEGTWMTQRDAQIPNRASPKPYRETSMYRSNVSLTFNQAIAIAINGPRNWGHWVYNVFLDDELTQYNASTWWLIGNTTLYYQSGLNPNKTYTLNVAHEGDSEFFSFSLNDITVWTVGSSDQTTVSSSKTIDTPPSSPPSQPSLSSSSSGSRNHVGVIVGPVIAAIAVIVGVIVLLFYRARTRRKATESNDVGPMLGEVTPYPKNQKPPTPLLTATTAATNIPSLATSSHIMETSTTAVDTSLEKQDTSSISPPPPAYTEIFSC